MLNILNDSGTTTQYKICTHCKQSFPKTTEFFYPVKGGINIQYFSPTCKECEHKRGKEYRKNNQDSIRKKNLDYISQEKNFVRDTFKKYFRPSYHIPKVNGTYTRIPWIPEITLKGFYEELFLHIELMKEKFPGTDGRICRYCDKPWTYIRRGKDGARAHTNFSIDRFDTNVTYKKGNIIFCCSKCNALKNASTKEMWIRFLEIDKEINEKKKKTTLA
jgi:hypothetical protein